MNKEYLSSIVGGASSNISASLLNALARIFGIVIEAGRAVGSAMSYAINGNQCK
jgi:hypothetical protein